jgi:hypothetical protein
MLICVYYLKSLEDLLRFFTSHLCIYVYKYVNRQLSSKGHPTAGFLRVRHYVATETSYNPVFSFYLFIYLHFVITALHVMDILFPDVIKDAVFISLFPENWPRLTIEGNF